MHVGVVLTQPCLCTLYATAIPILPSDFHWKSFWFIYNRTSGSSPTLTLWTSGQTLHPPAHTQALFKGCLSNVGIEQLGWFQLMHSSSQADLPTHPHFAGVTRIL